MAGIGGVSLSQMGEPPFEYATASIEARDAYLKEIGATMEKKLMRAMVSPSGVGPTYRLLSTETHPTRNEIAFIIEVGGSVRKNPNFSGVKQQIFKDRCPDFARSELGSNDIRIVQRFVDGRKKPLGSIALSMSACAAYI